MVLWCKGCGALLGLREPLGDWSTDKSGVCPKCIDQHVGTMPTVAAPNTKEAEDQEPTVRRQGLKLGSPDAAPPAP